MKKEWLHWIVGREKSSKRRSKDKMVQEAATSAGCMCAVFQVFDLHFPLNDHHFLQQEEDDEDEQAIITTSKGVEAPRNSLEVEKPVGLKSLAMKEEQDLNLPVGIMHIKTGHQKILSSPRVSKSTTTTADDCYSGSETKTPTLVARLMGLDLLPSEANSPSFSNSKPQKSPSHLNYQRKDSNILQTRSNKAFSDDDISVGAHSLPETPRISSSRRSDVDYYHHRLSLQVNKENRNDEFRVSSGGKTRRGKSKRQDENTSSPRHFAQQIVKQVKESVSRRRVGLMDITNTKDNNKNKSEQKPTRRDGNLVLLKPSKKNALNRELISPDMTPPSCSPRLRFLETNIKPKQVPTKSPRNPIPVSENNPSKPNSIVTTPLQENQKKLPPKVTDHFRSKKEESFVTSKVTNKQSLAETNKAKKATLSNELLSLSGPSLLPVKKGPSPAATKLPQKQSQVSDAVSVSSKRRAQLPAHPYSHHLPRHQVFSTSRVAVSNSDATGAYTNYIKRILKRARITNVATSHSLDPTIFHYLELFGVGENSVLSCRSNRKLVFHLVDELLTDISKNPIEVKSVNLADELCKHVSRFPVKKCEVLEDIDELVGFDLSQDKGNGLVLDSEMERVVREIESGIFEKLVFETVAVVATEAGRGHGTTGGTWERLT